MSIEYGIVTIGTLSTNTSNYEAGYVFTANENLFFHGFRIYPYAATTNVVCRLWDAETKTELAQVPVASVTTKTWNEFRLDAPIKLRKGKSYAISYYSSPTRYRQTIATAEFNPRITVTSGCYTSTNGAYPSTVDSTYTHQLVDCIIEEMYMERYLVQCGSKLFTVVDGALTEIQESAVSADVFRTYGIDEPPDGTLLAGLTDPEVLFWHDSTDELPVLTLTVKGTPPLPQMFTSESMDLTHESIAGIDRAAVSASEDVRFAISFDDGITWQAHDGSAWFTVSDTAPGMLASTMNAITAEQWAEVVQLTAYRLRFWLPNVTAYVASVVMHYINP
jgi:hypothetical protein